MLVRRGGTGKVMLDKLAVAPKLLPKPLSDALHHVVVRPGKIEAACRVTINHHNRLAHGLVVVWSSQREY